MVRNWNIVKAPFADPFDPDWDRVEQRVQAMIAEQDARGCHKYPPFRLPDARRLTPSAPAAERLGPGDDPLSHMPELANSSPPASTPDPSPASTPLGQEPSLADFVTRDAQGRAVQSGSVTSTSYNDRSYTEPSAMVWGRHGGLHTMPNALTEAGRAQIGLGITVNLTLFVACMASLFWDGMAKTEKRKDILNIFFGTGIVSSAAGILLGVLAYNRDYIDASNFWVVRGEVLGCPFISVTAMIGAMLVLFFSSEGSTA